MASRLIEVVLQGVDRTKKAFASVGRNLNRLIGYVREFALKASVAFGAGGGAVAAISSMADELTRVLNVARQLDTTVEAISGLEFATRRYGATAGDLESALSSLNEKIGDARSGGTEAAEAFAALGLSADQLARLTLEERFLAIADAVAASNDQTVAYSKVLEILGEGAERLYPALRQGSDAFRDLTREAREAGKILSTEDAEAAEKFSRQLDIMSQEIGVVGRKLANELIPQLTFFAALARGASVGEAFGLVTEDLGILPPSLRKISDEIAEVKFQLREIESGPSWLDLLVPESERGRPALLLRAELANLQQAYREELERLAEIRQAAGERETAFRERQAAARAEALKDQITARKAHTAELAAILNEEQSLLERIANAGREVLEGAEAVTLGDELDPTDLFLRYQEGLRQLAAGDTDAAEQTIENIVDAMDKLNESGELNILTARNLRGNLSDLASQIADVRSERLIEDAEGVELIDVDKIGEDAAQVREIIQAELDKVVFRLRWEDGSLAAAKEEASAAVSNLPATVSPDVTALKIPVQTQLDEASIEETKAAAQQALTGVTADVAMVPTVGPVAGGYVPTLGEHGEPVYGDASAAEGHKL